MRPFNCLSVVSSHLFCRWWCLCVCEHMSIGSGNSFLRKILFSDQDMLGIFSVYMFMCVCVCKNMYIHTHVFEMVSVRATVHFRCLLHPACSGWMQWSRASLQLCYYQLTAWPNKFILPFLWWPHGLGPQTNRCFESVVSLSLQDGCNPFLLSTERSCLHHKYKSFFVRETMRKHTGEECVPSHGRWRSFRFAV